MTRFLAMGAIALAIGLTGCVDRSAQQQAKRTEKIAGDRSRAVEVTSPIQKTLEETLDINGQIATSEDTNVGAKQSGKLVMVTVQDGAQVTAGQVLAMQDTAGLQAQLQQSLAQVASARASLSQAISNAALGPAKSSAALNTALAQVRSAKSQLQKQLNGARPEERRQALATLESAKKNLEVQQKNLDRIQTLVTQGAVAANQLDAQQNAVASAKSTFQSAQEAVNLQNAGNRAEDIAAARETVRQAEESVKNARAAKDLDVLYKDQVNAAKAQVDSAMAQVRIVQQNISDMTIKAPFSGRVSGKPAQVGTVVAPGATIVRLVGNEAPYFEGSVPEYELGRVKIGSTVTVKIDSMGDRTFAGRVAAYNPLGTAVGRQFTARIELQGDTSAIRPGMFATGTIVVKRMPNSTLVPVRAVVTIDGETAVFVAEGTKAKRAPVKTGITQGDLIQVSGVPAGAQVIVKGQEALNDGSLIKVSAPAATAAGSVGG